MLVVCWSGDTSGQILVTLSGRGDIGQAVVSESANQVSDQLSRCGVGTRQQPCSEHRARSTTKVEWLDSSRSLIVGEQQHTFHLFDLWLTRLCSNINMIFFSLLLGLKYGRKANCPSASSSPNGASPGYCNF